MLPGRIHPCLVVTPVSLRPWHARSSSLLTQAAKQGGYHAMSSRIHSVKCADFLMVG